MARRGWRSLGKRGGEARAIVPRVLPRRVVGKVGLHLGARECELVSRAHAGDLHDGASVRPAVEVAVVEGEEDVEEPPQKKHKGADDVEMQEDDAEKTETIEEEPTAADDVEIYGRLRVYTFYRNQNYFHFHLQL